ncbi:acyltransferase [Tepidimonas taiwanensis]|nr:acyltransferase [Tepidimonas taiwanensis]UBQ04947.1 acyltransferase [Tepidimonas taiwanensis]
MPSATSTASFSFITPLHGLRGIAALAVLLFHWSLLFSDANARLAQWSVPEVAWLNPTLLYSLGFEGVFLFFVLSGYLLTTALAYSPRPLSEHVLVPYLLRRSARIYPAVWAQLGVLCAAGALLPGWPLNPLEQPLWPQILLWLHLPPGMHAPVNGVWWTLPVELIFYLILPFLLVLMRRVGWRVVLLLAILLTAAWRQGVILTLSLDDYSGSVYKLDTTAGVLSSFVFGMCASEWMRSSYVRSPRHWIALGLTGVVACNIILMTNIGTYWRGGVLLVFWNTALSGCLALVVAGFAASTHRTVLDSRWMQWMGERSYGLYLWHLPVMYAALMGWPEIKSQIVTSLLIVLGTTALCAELSYRLVERPAMRAARQWSQRFQISSGS